MKYHFADRQTEEENTDTDSEEESDISEDELQERTRNLLYESKGWTPPSGQDQNLDAYCNQTENIILNEAERHLNKQNITKKERLALEDLKNDPEIIIKPADKGGKIVIMNTTDYETECLRQLNNNEVYVETAPIRLKEINKEIDNTIRNYGARGLIEDEICAKLTNNRAQIPAFYILPKIHKEGNPGRPIVSGINCPTERISLYVDQTIRPYVKQIPSYIKDTNHLLQMLEEVDIEEGDMLCTLDVSSLYTNIPHIEGLQALRKTLDYNHQENPPSWVITRLADIVLRNNIMQFGGNTYMQIQGTAMGTRMAPSYANIFMAEHEKQLLNGYPLKPKMWKRYIDDVITIWPHGQEEWEKFKKYLNDSHPSIKFTGESSLTTIPMLDVLIKKENNKLETTMFTKKTDAQLYLHYSSCHPKKTKDSIPYSQLLRARRICSKQEDYIHHRDRILKLFQDRNYNQTALDQAKLAVDQMDRRDLLYPERRTSEEKTRLITNYNPRNPDLRKIIFTHADALQKTRKKFIEPKDIQVGYSRKKNIRNILVRSLHPKPTFIPGCRKCTKGCATCPLIKTATEVTSKYGKTYKVNGSFDCQSVNCVYTITCTKCGDQYCGESSQTINQRFRGHVHCIRANKDNPVAKHFNQQNHSEHDLAIIIVDRATQKNERLRLENAWILLLNSRVPFGINARTLE